LALIFLHLAVVVAQPAQLAQERVVQAAGVLLLAQTEYRALPPPLGVIQEPPTHLVVARYLTTSPLVVRPEALQTQPLGLPNGVAVEAELVLAAQLSSTAAALCTAQGAEVLAVF
jgi:hypothetical protein